MLACLFFWICVALIVYIYLGYPALVWVLSQWRGSRPHLVENNFEPTVSLIIAAFNEEQVIAHKLENCLALDYARDKLEIVVVSDGSTDETAIVVCNYKAQGIQLVALPQNVGKASAQNEAVKRASGDILLFTDANVLLQQEAVRRLVRHFVDSRVGCVVGQVTYLNEGETGVSEGEGFYWRYELFLRHKESLVGNLLAGSGPIMAVRRALFEALDPAVSEDFVLPMRAAIRGYRTVYEPEAISSERLFQVHPRDMFRTRVRTVMLDSRSMFLCRAILNPFRYPLYTWGLLSHKLLRWLAPCVLIALFVANLFLLGQLFYKLTWMSQVTFYCLALIGCVWQTRGKPPQIVGIPLAFCLINLAALIGTAQFVMGKRAGRWEPVRM